jgi:hypothetical protein
MTRAPAPVPDGGGIGKKAFFVLPFCFIDYCLWAISSMAFLSCFESSGQAVIIRLISGYFCNILSKLVDKTGFCFSVSSLFSMPC